MDEKYCLCHYGIMGQKWGIRRYQNSDGTLTAEGRKRYRQEVRADNKEAFRRGKEATVYARALDVSQKKLNKNRDKLAKAFAKDPKAETERTKKLIKKQLSEVFVSDQISEKYNQAEKAAIDHQAQLIKKYGNDKVSNIRYSVNKYGNSRVNERVANGATWVGASLASLGLLGIGVAAHSPISIILTPKSAKQLGREAYDVERMLAEQHMKRARENRGEQ